MRLLSFFSFLSVAGCAGLLSCSSPSAVDYPENVISHNDFESLDGWIPANPSLTTAKAHSGRYSLKVDNDVEYSMGYVSPLAAASATRIKKLDVNAWTLITGKDTGASLVVEVKNPANSEKIFWEALNLANEAKAINKWVEVKRTFVLPDNVEPTHELRVYLWRGGATPPVFLDDVVISRSE